MNSQYPVVTKEVPTFYFIGVTTSKSSIMRVFPRWAADLGRGNTVTEGVDLKIHDTRDAYRAAVAQIKYDPLSLGSLVTTHKIDLYEAAGNMFDSLDRYATLCGEISCISKQDGKLMGHAKDPLTAGMTLDSILGDGYFGQTGGNVFCFSAGSAAAATLLHLIDKKLQSDRPRIFTVVNRSPARLERLKLMVDKCTTDISIEYICQTDAAKNDALVRALPEGSLVINATGMGKDIPGSPVTDDVAYPINGVVWEFNYRGERCRNGMVAAVDAGRYVWELPWATSTAVQETVRASSWMLPKSSGSCAKSFELVDAGFSAREARQQVTSEGLRTRKGTVSATAVQD